MSASEALLGRLGDVPTITDPALVRCESRDFYWYSPILKEQLDSLEADIVVVPRSEAEVITVVKACFALDVPLTVRAAGTGNYGQCMPLRRGVVLEMTALDAIVWTRPGRVRTQAGMKMNVLEEQCRQAVSGELRLYPSTWRTATIGGFIAGGSSGLGAVTWGLLRDPGISSRPASSPWRRNRACSSCAGRMCRRSITATAQTASSPRSSCRSRPPCPGSISR